MRIKNKNLTSVPVTPNPADPWAASDPAAFMKARQDVAGTGRCRPATLTV